MFVRSVARSLSSSLIFCRKRCQDVSVCSACMNKLLSMCRSVQAFHLVMNNIYLLSISVRFLFHYKPLSVCVFLCVYVCYLQPHCQCTWPCWVACGKPPKQSCAAPSPSSFLLAALLFLQYPYAPTNIYAIELPRTIMPVQSSKYLSISSLHIYIYILIEQWLLVSLVCYLFLV